MNNAIVADRIRSEITMTELLTFYGVEVKRGRCKCPFHDGQDYNCGVKPDYIHCFVCGESSDQIGFVQKYFSLPFVAAVAKINADFGLGMNLGRERKGQALEAAKRAFLRRTEREEQRRDEERAIADWLEAHGEYANALRAIRENVPIKGQDPNPRFIEAIKDIEYIKYKIGQMEERIYQNECHR